MIHNLYESPAAKYDLALVKIKGRFRFNPSAWPICVPEKEQPRVDHKGNAYTLLGYGRNINNEERGEVLTAEVLKVYVSFFEITFIRLNIHRSPILMKKRSNINRKKLELTKNVTGL